MYLLSKILPLFVLPPGIVLLLALAGLLLRRWWLIRAAVLILWVFSLPVVGSVLSVMVENPYHRVAIEDVGKGDAIVVLSGMINQTEGAPLGEWGEAADRFEGGIELYKAGKAPSLVFTGGYVPGQPDFVPEGTILVRRAIRLGIPNGSLMLTSKVANTADEAVATAHLLGVSSRRPKRILLVTSAGHMHRAIRLFRAAGFLVEPYPVDFRDNVHNRRITVRDVMPTASALEASSSALRELMGRVVASIGVTFLVSGK